MFLHSYRHVLVKFILKYVIFGGVVVNGFSLPFCIYLATVGTQKKNSILILYKSTIKF